MQRIKLLDAHLANQIAAGEVVERPASIVKELIENSLDAGAKNIEIDIQKGGIQRIFIRDDGYGILKEDLNLAISRHATSKIHELVDLEHIASFGFRGEALASISAVSRFILASRVSQDTHGWQIRVNGREADISQKPIAHAVGTSIEICDLFYNTPARRKFLKSEQTEFSHLQEVVRRIALSIFNTGFSLKHNQRQIFKLSPAHSLEEKTVRASEICGSDFIKNSLRLETAANDLYLWGWFGLPDFSRAQADLQYIYINGRMVKDKTISHAVKQAYRDILYQDRQPAYVLYLDMDPALVDVNVHPAKQEVRFRDNRMIFDFVFQRVKQLLGNTENQKIQNKIPLTSYTTSNINNNSHSTSNPNLSSNSNLITHTHITTSPINSTLPEKKSSIEATAVSAATSTQKQISLYAEVLSPEKPLSNPKTPPFLKGAADPALVAGEAGDLHAVPLLGFALAQLKGIYILAENAQGLVLVDMHAAHERIVYEKLKRDYEKKTIVTQTLLLPLHIRLSIKEVELVESQKTLWQSLGFDVERISPENITIRQIPVLLKESNIEVLIKDLISDVETYQTTSRTEEKLNELLASMACRGALRAGRNLSLPEMNALLREIENTPHGGYCCHGRPAWKEFNLKELDKLFLRGR